MSSRPRTTLAILAGGALAALAVLVLPSALFPGLGASDPEPLITTGGPELRPADVAQEPTTTVVVEPDPSDVPPPPAPPEDMPPGTVGTEQLPGEVVIDVEEGPSPPTTIPGLGPKPGAEPRDPIGTIEATFGFAGYATPDRAVPVLVEVTAEEQLDGVLELTAGGGEVAETTVRRAIDVDAGATERHWMLAPPDPSGFRQLDVTLLDGQGRLAGRASEELIGGEDHEVIGMLPDVDARTGWTEPWRNLPIVRTGLVFADSVDPEMLALGPLSLDPLDQLVGTATELADLDEDHLAAVLAWVDTGGQLLVVGDPEPLTALALPDGWAPPEGGSARAGLGAVRSVGSDWFADVLPSPTRSVVEDGPLSESLRFADLSQLELSLARDAKATLKPAGTVWLAVVVYIAVAGPVVFLVTRRLRRRKAPWLAVPAVAVLFSTVTLTAGTSFEAPRLAEQVSSTEVTVYETGPAGTRATTWAVLANDGGDDVGARLPRSWSAVTPYGNVFPNDSRGIVDLGPDGAEVVLRARRDTYAMVQAHGVVPDMRDALVVTATSADDGVVRATVRNRLDVTLDHVLVLTGRNAVTEVGTLGPGESRDVTVEGTTDFVWEDEPEPGRWRDRDLPIDAWTSVVRRTGWNYRPLGQVLAVGWTSELDPRIEPTRTTASVDHVRAAVVARTTVQPADGSDRLSDAAVVRRYLRGPGAEVLRLAGRDPNRPEAEAVAERDEDGVVGILYGFELPATVGDRAPDPDRLVLGIPDRYDAVEVWTGPGGWQQLPVPEPDAGQREVPLPEGAVIDGGRVLVRVAVPLGEAAPEPGHEFVLYESEGS